MRRLCALLLLAPLAGCVGFDAYFDDIGLYEWMAPSECGSCQGGPSAAAPGYAPPGYAPAAGTSAPAYAPPASQTREPDMLKR